MAADCATRCEDVSCDLYGKRGHVRKVCLTSYEEKPAPSAVKKRRDKTPGPLPSVKKTTDYFHWCTW